MVGADSRSVLPFRKDWVSRLKARSKRHHEVQSIRQYHNHWLFSIYIFETYLKSLEDGALDLIIVQSGWHEGICYWTPDTYKSIVRSHFNEECLVKKIMSPRPVLNLDGQKLRNKGTKPEPLYLYIDRESEAAVFGTILKKAKRCLFIGMQTIKNENNLDKEFHLGKQHHYDALIMNDSFSKLDIDFLHMPMDWQWVEQNTIEDNLHYNSSGRDIVVSCVELYLSRIQSNNMVKKCVDSKDFYAHALIENDFAIAQPGVFGCVPHWGDERKCSETQWKSGRYKSRGKILPGVSVVIVRDGEDVTNDDDGNVMIKSSHEPHAKISDFYGYHDTGDIGFIQNGELYVIKEGS